MTKIPPDPPIIRPSIGPACCTKAICPPDTIWFADTVTTVAAVFVTPSMVTDTEISAVPGATAVTRPEASTVATLRSLLEKDRTPVTLAVTRLTTAESCTVLSGSNVNSVNEDGVSSSEVNPGARKAGVVTPSLLQLAVNTSRATPIPAIAMTLRGDGLMRRPVFRVVITPTSGFGFQRNSDCSQKPQAFRLIGMPAPSDLEFRLIASTRFWTGSAHGADAKHSRKRE